MNFLKFLEKIFIANSTKTAIIYREKKFSYEFLLHSFYEQREKLKSIISEKNAVVSLTADFSPYSIPVLLAMIDSGFICVPFSYAAKNLEESINIAEVEWKVEFDGEQLQITKTGITTSKDLILKLKGFSHPGLILFSSGTTGVPKAALHDLIPLLNKYKIPAKTFRTISFLLFDHIGGFNTLMYILANAGTLVVSENRTPGEVCRLIDAYNVELLPVSPSFINMLLFSCAYEQYDISSLKMISYGTEPMPEATLLNFNKLFPDVVLKQTYGLSEIGIMKTKSENSGSLWLKVGGEDYETKIVDDILWIKTSTAMLGYLNAPSPFTPDGWFVTGDKVEKKGDYIKILGRETDIINVGGQKVYPVEVESVLLQIPGIMDAAVRGEKNALLGNIVVANIATGNGQDNNAFIAEIKKFCKGKLEKYKIPVKINLYAQTSFTNTRFKRVR